MAKKNLLEGLSDQQIAEVKACKNQDELLALADKEGVELTEEQLLAVSGGACSNSDKNKKENNHRKIES